MDDRDVGEGEPSPSRVLDSEMLRQIQDSVQIILLQLDKQGRIVHYNRFLEELSGYPLDEMRGKSWFDNFLPEDERERFHEVFDNAVRGEPVGGRRNAILTRDGGRRIIDWHGAGQESGEQILAIGTDVTEEVERAERLAVKTVQLEGVVEQTQAELDSATEEKQAAQRLLAESLSFVELVFRDMKTHVAVLDRDMRFIRVNRSYAESAGHPPESFVGKGHFDLYPHEENEMIFRAVAETGIPYEVLAKPFEYPDQPEKGVTYWDWNLDPLRDKAGEVVGVVLSLLDVTTKQRALLEVQQLNDELERRVERRTSQLIDANKELESFAYSVSHDLRAPLRAIDGYCAALDEDYGSQLEGMGTTYLQRIRVSSERMGVMISQLLELARISRRPLELKPVRVADVVHEVVRRLREGEPKRVVTFTLVDPYEAMVRVDPLLFELALQNLLSNAWKFTRKLEDARVEVVVHAMDEELCVEVLDNGAGFEPAYGANIFEAFQRMHHPEDFEGTGVGLAIVRRIVGRHFGRFGASSSGPGTGAKLWFTVPPAAPEDLMDPATMTDRPPQP